jgi:hypothetical protein
MGEDANQDSPALQPPLIPSSASEIGVPGEMRGIGSILAFLNGLKGLLETGVR